MAVQTTPAVGLIFGFSSTGRVPPPFGFQTGDDQGQKRPAALYYHYYYYYDFLVPLTVIVHHTSPPPPFMLLGTPIGRPRPFQGGKLSTIVRLITGSYQSFPQCLECFCFSPCCCLFLFHFFFLPSVSTTATVFAAAVDACGIILPSWNSFDGLLGSNHQHK